ncbi:hypothetical protein RHSIM_Rhsim04G0090700 [Rhododendron simsii]|uniref:Disease resistance protein At4g27190-like leucine-rich repeats domain-containing protein n=1 Tax=Rhododendron simsii TaxID=118357 RepID=A0A834H6B4_RHOSS|nr:hypothetical protein RHSIM_Rhsim04G0090700 [Rhododendron simsii]
MFMGDLREIWPGELQAKLRKIEVYRCDLFPSNLIECMEKLERLTVESCKSVEVALFDLGELNIGGEGNGTCCKRTCCKVGEGNGQLTVEFIDTSIFYAHHEGFSLGLVAGGMIDGNIGRGGAEWSWREIRERGFVMMARWS